MGTPDLATKKCSYSWLPLLPNMSWWHVVRSIEKNILFIELSVGCAIDFFLFHVFMVPHSSPASVWVSPGEDEGALWGKWKRRKK